jgi:hypothetical protein
MSRANKERKQTLISACACLVGGVVFGHMGYSHHVALQEARRLVREGVETTATVDRVYASGRRSRSYYVEYRYEAAGLRLAGRGETTRADYEQLEQGMRIPVRFDPKLRTRVVSEPEHMRLESWSGRIGNFIVSAVMVAVFVLVVTGLVRQAPRIRPDTPRKSKSPSSGSRR